MTKGLKLSSLLAAFVACCVLAPAASASWSLVTATPASATSQLRGVACTSSSNCLVVGLQSSTTQTGLTARWNGATFTGTTPQSTSAEFYGVGCTNTQLCFAVGSSLSTPHAQIWNGTTWMTSTTAAVGGATFAQLASVSCPGTTTCYAAGSYTTATESRPLIERWSGSTWATQTVTMPGGATNAQLADVACSATNTCTAVGSFDTTNATTPRLAMALRWNGSTWTIQTPVSPTGHTGAELAGVACTSATVCNAVGSYTDSTGTQHALAQQWNGTTWTQKTVPDPTTGQLAALADIACTSGTACTAVGGYSNIHTNSITPLATAFNGTHWTVSTTPKPHGASDATLTSVACPSTCLAVGVSDYDGTTTLTGLRPLVMTGP